MLKQNTCMDQKKTRNNIEEKVTNTDYSSSNILNSNLKIQSMMIFFYHLDHVWHILTVNFHTCILFYCKVPSNLFASVFGNLHYFTCCYECFVSVKLGCCGLSYALCPFTKEPTKKKDRFGECFLILNGQDKKKSLWTTSIQ